MQPFDDPALHDDEPTGYVFTCSHCPERVRYSNDILKNYEAESLLHNRGWRFTYTEGSEAIELTCVACRKVRKDWLGVDWRRTAGARREVVREEKRKVLGRLVPLR